MHVTFDQTQEILTKSQVLYTADELSHKIKNIAKEIEAEIDNQIPLFLTVMNGGMFFSTEVMKHIKKPFTADYIHASRYGDATFGSGHISWYRQPKEEDVKGRVVYVFDDILDEGYTLAEIVRLLNHLGAKQCRLVVLIDKNLGVEKPINADYVGYTSPNKYLFGYGMDIYGLYRQLTDIYVYNG